MSPLRAPLECHFRFFCFPLSHSLFLLCQWVRPFGSSCANKCVAEAITPATPHHTVTVPLLTPFPCSHLCTLLHRAFDRAWCPPPQSTAVSTPATPHHAVTVPLLTPISLFTSMCPVIDCCREGDKMRRDAPTLLHISAEARVLLCGKYPGFYTRRGPG